MIIDVGAFVHEALGCGQANVLLLPPVMTATLPTSFFMIFYILRSVLCSIKSLRSTGPYRGQSCAGPPSTATSLAVMKLLSDDARKAAAAATSAGSPMRCSAVIEP